jgi:acetyl esterase/lipase
MKKLPLFFLVFLVPMLAFAEGKLIKLSTGAEMTVYLPEADKAIGRAVVDCPGGGYSHLSMDNEGHNWAGFYNDLGIAYGVLKYRMPNGDRNIPLSDAYEAIKTFKDNAELWHINPNDIGIQGFSAGGHLASAVSTHAPANLRPNFSVLFYPVISMDERVTHKGSCVGFLGDSRSDSKLVKEWSSHEAVDSLTPPAIIILASDDRAVPPLTNGFEYYISLRKAGKKASMHAYPSGGHGFGFKDTWKYHDIMLKELEMWLKE